MNDKEIRELFEKWKVPLPKSDTWAVQGTPVIKHQALERLGAAMELIWREPMVIRADRDEAVVMVGATLADGSGYEWSFGEALIKREGGHGNYQVSGKQAGYVWAMAEKRAKDRVIIKMARLYGALADGELESEGNAAQSPPAPAQAPAESGDAPGSSDTGPANDKPMTAIQVEAMHNAVRPGTKVAAQKIIEAVEAATGGTAQVDTDPAMTRLMKEIEAAPAAGDTSAAKMARVIQGLEDVPAIERFLNQATAKAARKAMSIGEAEVFGRWVAQAKRARENASD